MTQNIDHDGFVYQSYRSMREEREQIVALPDAKEGIINNTIKLK